MKSFMVDGIRCVVADNVPRRKISKLVMDGRDAVVLLNKFAWFRPVGVACHIRRHRVPGHFHLTVQDTRGRWRNWGLM